MRHCICKALVQCRGSGIVVSLLSHPEAWLVDHGWEQRCLKVLKQDPFLPEWWMLPFRWVHGGVLSCIIEKGEFGPVTAIVQIAKRSLYLWPEPLAFAKETNVFSPCIHPIRCPCIAHTCTTF